MSGSSSGSIVTGSSANMVARMRAVLPASWFPLTEPGSTQSASPVLDAILAGPATAWSFCFGLLVFVRQQSRLATMTGSLLDLFSDDFFGSGLRRRAGENDLEFGLRIKANLLLPRATRSAVSAALQSLTGVVPFLFEPSRGSDTGGYGDFGLGYGSGSMPFQYLVAVSGFGAVRRETVASYLDLDGRLQVAPRHALRPNYINGALVGSIVEGRGINLLKDSVGWSGFTTSTSTAERMWSVCAGDTTAMWAAGPTVRISVGASGPVVGPCADIYVGDVPVCASAWVLVPAENTLTSLALVLSDGTSNVIAAANVTQTDIWQRLVASLSQPDGNRTVTVMLAGTASSPMGLPVVTQCWQLEQGLSATSYIPSAGQIGLRDADQVESSATVNDSIGASSQDIREALGRVVPAGSITWLNVQSAL